MKWRLNKKSNNFIPTKPSSEEQFIQNYLGIRGFKYIREYEKFNLIDDKKKSRRIDFYLPKLDVYVEHYGWYNKSKEKRAEYDEKTRVFIKNDMATVIIHPHELGFLDYVFHNKLLKVLRVPKFKNNYKMFRYKLNRYTSIGKGYFFFLSLLSLFISLIFLYDIDDNNITYNNILFGLFFSGFFTLFGYFILNIIRIFYYDE